MSSVQIEGVRAIRQLEIPIESGSVVVLRGPSGAGKSTALKAVAAGITGKGNGLLPTDGRESGAIRVPGVTVRIGARTTSRGKPEHNWVVVEDTQGIATLIDPDIKDPAAADKRRIETLLSMVGVGGSGDAIRAFLGEQLSQLLSAEVAKLERLPLVDAVGGLKRVLEEQARTAEAEVQRLRGTLDAIGELPEPVEPPTSEKIEDLKRIAQARSREVIQLESRRDAAQEAARALANLVEVDDECVEVLACREADLLELQNREAELAAELQQVREAIGVQKAHRDAARKDVERREQVLRQRAEAQQKLQGQVTEEQLREACEARDAAEAEAVAAMQVRHKAAELDALRQKALTARSGLEKSEASAVALRSAAKSVPNILQQAVQHVGDFSVSLEGRLCVEHKRGTIPFAELSPGERTIRAIEVVAKTVNVPDGHVPVIPLPQECFEALSGNFRKRVAEFAEDKGICFVTALPSDDYREEGIDVDVFRVDEDGK